MEESTHVIFDESIPLLHPHMSGDDNDVGTNSRNQEESHVFLDEVILEDQSQEVHPPNQEAGTQGDEAQIEDLQLPSSSHHDLPRT